MDDGVCGGITPPGDEFDCDWTISAGWPEVCCDIHATTVASLSLHGDDHESFTFAALELLSHACVDCFFHAYHS